MGNTLQVDFRRSVPDQLPRTFLIAFSTALEPDQVQVCASAVKLSNRPATACISLCQRAPDFAANVYAVILHYLRSRQIAIQVVLHEGRAVALSRLTEPATARRHDFEALAVTSATRMSQLSDVPTVAEQGFPGYEVHSWWGIVAPTGVPKPILQRMHAELKNILGTPEMRERLELLGMTIRASSPDEFARHIAVEMKLWGKVVRDNKISAAE